LVAVQSIWRIHLWKLEIRQFCKSRLLLNSHIRLELDLAQTLVDPLDLEVVHLVGILAKVDVRADLVAALGERACALVVGLELGLLEEETERGRLGDVDALGAWMQGCLCGRPAWRGTSSCARLSAWIAFREL
jgi:hypothetical protein